MKQVSGGIYYTAAGAIFGVIGVARVLTLVQPALDRFASFACGTGPASGLGIDRSEVFVAILCGVLAIVCAEVGSRRYARPKWIGMMGSILGVFSLLAGALIAVELFISPAASCVK
jgi:hypothetical protein